MVFRATFLRRECRDFAAAAVAPRPAGAGAAAPVEGAGAAAARPVLERIARGARAVDSGGVRRQTGLDRVRPTSLRRHFLHERARGGGASAADAAQAARNAPLVVHFAPLATTSRYRQRC